MSQTRSQKLAAQWMIKQTRQRVAVKLPSEEERGKPAHDADFKAGFAAGKAAYKKDDQVDISAGEKAYRRVSKKHGSWWVDGFGAALEASRPGGGAYATKGSQIAKKLKLKSARQK